MKQQQWQKWRVPSRMPRRASVPPYLQGNPQKPDPQEPQQEPQQEPRAFDGPQYRARLRRPNLATL